MNYQFKTISIFLVIFGISACSVESDSGSVNQALELVMVNGNILAVMPLIPDILLPNKSLQKIFRILKKIGSGMGLALMPKADDLRQAISMEHYIPLQDQDVTLLH